jgi:hypothetical protein
MSKNNYLFNYIILMYRMHIFLVFFYILIVKPLTIIYILNKLLYLNNANYDMIREKNYANMAERSRS